MATACIAQLIFRGEHFPKPVVARCDQPDASADGGAILLKTIDAQLGLSAGLAAGLRDRREPGKVSHSVHDLLRQRLFGLACGYADTNDAARLSADPMHKLLLDRDPLGGPALTSQPTLSRFENAATRSDLFRLGARLARTVLDFHAHRLGDAARLITIDIDQTDDPTHGQQELAFFHGYYDTWCYLPLIATVSFNAEPMQHLVAALLRPGRGPATGSVRGLLRRLVSELRARFPRARVRVRLDAGFAHPKLLTFLEAMGTEYVVALQGNPRLHKRIRRLQGRARMRARLSGRSERLFGETRYAARRWPHKRRVIMKAEALCYPGRPTKNNPRFVVTNVSHRPERVYAIYCGRGDMENRIKELQDGLASDRTSCSRFLANQFRLLLSAAAYVLYQVLQWHARTTGMAGAQVTTLREHVIKLAVWVERSVRRIVLHLPRRFVGFAIWHQLAHALAAT